MWSQQCISVPSHFQFKEPCTLYKLQVTTSEVILEMLV